MILMRLSKQKCLLENRIFGFLVNLNCQVQEPVVELSWENRWENIPMEWARALRSCLGASMVTFWLVSKWKWVIKDFLVGGSNPVEKHLSNWIIFPGIGVKILKKWNHHLASIETDSNHLSAQYNLCKIRITSKKKRRNSTTCFFQILAPLTNHRIIFLETPSKFGILKIHPGSVEKRSSPRDNGGNGWNLKGTPKWEKRKSSWKTSNLKIHSGSCLSYMMLIYR